MACSLGQACAAGVCGGGGALRDDGCMGLAANLTISQVAVYQTVKIPIMQNGNEVQAAARNTDVVTGRAALFRVSSTVSSGWTARELSARVFIQNADTVEVFHAKATVSGSSQEADLATTFQVNVPKGKLTPNSRYAIEVVECGATTAGTTQGARFPASDGILLGARATGPLKIRMIPMQANSMVPDTSEAGLLIYKTLIEALFPVDQVQFTVGDVLAISNATDWSGNLDRLRQRRQMDAPAADIYYYGLLKPANSLRDFCRGGCTTGIGYVPGGSGNNQAAQRVSMGIGFADNASAETMAHEVAHNHGRSHAPCGNGISGVDGNFPYNGGQVGVYGYDTRNQRLIAPDRTDLMGYCSNKWLSDYTYDALMSRVATVNGAMDVLVPPELVREWNVLLLDDQGPRWGGPINVPSAPAGDPEPAEILNQHGHVIAIETVFRTEISDIDAASFEVPKPRPGWHAVRVAGAPALVY